MKDRPSIAGQNEYNKQVVRIMTNTDKSLRKLLGSRYLDFRKGIRKWWSSEQLRVKQIKEQSEASTLSDAVYCNVYGTQYNGNTNYEVALPDKYVKFANLGWPTLPQYNNLPYTSDIYREENDSWVYRVTVREVGPWNEDDNYWDLANGANPRRLFTDIPLCWSEAEYAYFYGYNNGKDQFGRIVTNPASIDLTPAVASDLGLRYLQNSWLWVFYDDLP